MLFCHVHSEVPDRKHRTLRADKGLLGLPSLAFLDLDGRVLVKVPFESRTVSGIAATGRRAERYVVLRAEAATDQRAAAAFLRMQLEEHQLDFAAAKARRRALDVAGDDRPDAALLATLDAMLVDLEVQDAVQRAGQRGRHTLGPRFLKMLRDGPKPTPAVSRGYWFAILEWAERARDARAFAEGLEGMRAALQVTDPGKPWVAPLLARYGQKLAELRQ